MANQLPVNPFSRQPVKKLGRLAGRSAEVREIRYYLDLTANGQSPHLALVGERGSGKTSLLNAAESIAKDANVLAIRLDLTEEIAASPGRFWWNVYSAWIEGAASAGCWGGKTGTIYEALFSALFARRLPAADLAVLRFPMVIAASTVSVESVHCPDGLIAQDFSAFVRTELADRALKGVAILIDEADCLRVNRPLLQSLRNVFQAAPASLMLAGTEAMFESVADVFSPIPRQFHRINVGPFARRADTREFIEKALPDAGHLHPDPEDVEELHALCAGDPAELQLYCHFMYRQIESGAAERMSLQPAVFREVLNQYRAHAAPTDANIVTAIENLPDDLLLGKRWLQFRMLSPEHMCEHERFVRELRSGTALSQDESAQLLREVAESLKRLHAAGVSRHDERFDLIGAPLSAGFWKSFVEVEKRKRWVWLDVGYATAIVLELLNSLVQVIGQAQVISIFTERAGEYSAVDAIEALRRDGTSARPSQETVFHLFDAVPAARKASASEAVDVTVEIQVGTDKEWLCVTLFEVGTSEAEERVAKWRSRVGDISSRYSIGVTLQGARRWSVPTDDEMQRIARIADVSIPAGFGPSEFDQAVSLFRENKLDSVIALFERMSKDRSEPMIHNNLAFCLLLAQRAVDAVEHANHAVLKTFDPLYELNWVLARHLSGDRGRAVEHMSRLLRHLEDRSYDDYQLVSVLVLSREGNAVQAVDDLPLRCAVQVSALRMGLVTAQSVMAVLSVTDASKSEGWALRFQIA